MIEVRNHSTALPTGVRDTYGVLGVNAKEAQSAQARVEAARQKVEALRTQKAKADAELKRAIAANDGRTDLNSLSRTVYRIATELAKAEAELEEAECLLAAWEAERRRVRFEQIAKELPELRARFAELYKQAALVLGRYYAVGTEARELVATLADRIPNGTVYYPPKLKVVLTDADIDPNPLPALRNEGYGELQTFQSWRRHCPLVPLKEK